MKIYALIDIKIHKSRRIWHAEVTLQKNWSTKKTCTQKNLHAIDSNSFIHVTSLQNFDEEVQSVAKDLVRGAVSLHREVMMNFRKTAQNFHYEVFNIRF